MTRALWGMLAWGDNRNADGIPYTRLLIQADCTHDMQEHPRGFSCCRKCGYVERRGLSKDFSRRVET